MKRVSAFIPALSMMIAFAAAAISFLLLRTHLTGSSGSAWFDAGCGEAGVTGGADCAAVLASPYSFIPPRTADAPPGTVHVPVALFGMIYYSVLFVWLLGVGRPSPQRRWVHCLPLLLVGFGLVSSVQLTWLMFTRLDAWCPWCLVTHVLNGMLAVCLVFMWPGRRRVSHRVRREEPAEGAERKSAGDPVEHKSGPFPSYRLLLMTTLAVLLVVFGQLQLYMRVTSARVAAARLQDLEQCMAAIERYISDEEALMRTWRSESVQEIEIRPDDPVYFSGDDPSGAPELVIFSDFECPSCKRFAEFAESTVLPFFSGNVRMAFKHFPLYRDCNPVTTARMHPHACWAAGAVEAARILGGGDAFWRAHDYLFEHQEELKRGGLTVEQIAGALGLDAGMLQQTMDSAEVARRIAEDAQRGRAYGVTGTPTVFLSGRRVDILARSRVEFWDGVAKEYWRERDIPRPDATRPGRAEPSTRP